MYSLVANSEDGNEGGRTAKAGEGALAELSLDSDSTVEPYGGSNHNRHRDCKTRSDHRHPR